MTGILSASLTYPVLLSTSSFFGEELGRENRIKTLDLQDHVRYAGVIRLVYLALHLLLIRFTSSNFELH